MRKAGSKKDLGVSGIGLGGSY